MNPCRICSHASRQEIDVALLARTPQRTVAAKYGLSNTSVARHALNHLLQPEQALRSAANQPEHEAKQAERPRSAKIQRWINPAPWERQLGESRPTFAAFQTYLELSAGDPTKEATYEQTAQAVGKNKSLISRWARVVRNGLTWRDRRDAWLSHVDRARAARLLCETEEARERWRSTGRTMQDLGAKRIAALDPQKLPVDEARRFVVDGAGLESRGLGVDRTVQVTNQQANLAINIAPERARARSYRTFLSDTKNQT
jgi:hypothetical protein